MLLRNPPVSVDIGSYSVKVAQLHEGRGGVRVLRFAEQPLPAGYRWEPGADRRPLVEAIRQALAKAGIRRRVAILALPRRQVTARITAYPPADRSALRRAIEYDLADQIPFPVDQVTLDFQPLGPSRDQPGLTDVLVVAAQRDLVREYLALAQDAGLSVAALTVDALALNDLLLLLPEGPPGITVTVEVGARSTTINISEGSRLRLTRSVGLAGHQLSLAIRDDLGVSLEEAEGLKASEGLALLERQPRPQRIAAWIENLQGEIRRSALSFGPAVISRLLLVGAGAAVPGLPDSLHSEFGVRPGRLSVGQLFPLARVRSGELHSADRCVLAMAEALRGIGQSAWTISLVPPELAKARRVRAFRRLGIAAAAAAVLAMVIVYLSGARAIASQKERVALLRSKAAATEAERVKAKQVLDERDRLSKQLGVVKPAEVRRYTALELLRAISEVAPSGVLLTHFTLRPGQPLQLQGSAPDSNSVVDLQAGLSRSPLVKRVALNHADRITPRDRSAPVVSFTITAHLWTEQETPVGSDAFAALESRP